MEVVGKIIVAEPEITGTSQRTGNPWKKRNYVLETLENYPKKIAFDFFGERVDQFPLNVGDTVRLSFDIDSREYNGRWYVSIRGWKSEPATAGAPAAAPQQTMPGGYAPAPDAAAAPVPPVANLGSSDDLPF